MISYTTHFTPSVASGTPSSSSVEFGVDTDQDPVFLSGQVKHSATFARLMLTLGRVVRMDDTPTPRDHSAYQAWVRGEYVKELQATHGHLAPQIESLRARQAQLRDTSAKLRKALDASGFSQARSNFWSWVRLYNREAWLKYDPIVSVQEEATFFEAFSIDESAYARVQLPHSGMYFDQDPVPGTTNIDFSVSLEREFARTRSYRPLHLGVGTQRVSVDTGVSSAVERKIELPESWVRGLVEVQAALALAPVSFTVSAAALAEVLARLESQREKEGPRSLLFDLTPGQPPQITIEPWGDVFTGGKDPYQDDEPRRIRVWGRRRLRVLTDLLPYADAVTVRLLDDGMPSFWTLTIDDITLTVGLSGWTTQDWAGKARFSAFVPASAADPDTAQKALELLRERLTLRPDDLTRALNVAPGESRALLQRLCVSGTAMYDPETGTYRHRALFPQVDLSDPTDTGREERQGVELHRSGALRVVSDEFVDGERVLTTHTQLDGRTVNTTLRRNVDGRVTSAECDCSHFQYHKMRQGPCRHLVATSMAGGM